MIKVVVALALCWPGWADSRLDALRTLLIGMRGRPPGSGGPRGATPQLTVAKHQLRDWVESRLGALPERGDEGEFERKLNAELREARVFCGTPEEQPCPEWTFLGFLNDLKLRRQAGFLIAQSAVGIECGYDQSAYVYSWSGEGWRRTWQNEQNTYTEKEYRPQILHATLIPPYILRSVRAISWTSG